jgi:response regulator RpfG family c-di-GMP phosphodiesterase
MGERAPGRDDGVSTQAGSVHRGVAEGLLADGRITREQYEAATAQQKRSGERIEEVLIEIEAVAEQDLLKYLASLHRTRFVSTERLSKADIDRATLDKVPKKLAERLNIVPVLFDAGTNTLSVVTADPHNFDALDQVQKGARVREVKPLVARPAAVLAAVAKLYRNEPFAFAALESKGKKESGRFEFASPSSFVSSGQSFRPVRAPTERPSLGSSPAPGKKAVAQPKRISMPNMSLPQESWGTSDFYIETLNVLITLLENSREELRGHSAQVARLTRKMGERIGLAPAELNAIVVAAYLHDLGKMSTYHLTALNVSQYEEPRLAAEKSYATPSRLMSSAKLAPATISAIEGMYERWDGKGLPNQAEAKEISLGARLLAITDTYLDLTENPRNPFQKTLAAGEACEVLGKYKGSVFDPHLVDLFRTTVTGENLRARILSDRHVALLVDPDPEETTVLELRMIQEGFEVRIARTLVLAREILEKGGIELVVSEIDLAPPSGSKVGPTGGESDGLSLLVEARRSPWGTDLPWLILSRRQGREEAQRAFELGVVDYVIKPAVTEVLVAKLKKELEKRAATASAARGVSGSLAEMALPDLVQILWHGRKSGALRIRRGADSGEVHFVDGMVVNSMWGKLRGEEAFYAMLRISDGEFALDPNFRAPEVVISASPEALLLEGMRRLDEG